MILVYSERFTHRRKGSRKLRERKDDGVEPASRRRRGGMGKKKSSRFSLSNALPIAWFSKLMTRTRTRQSSSSGPCRFPSPCNAGKSMSDLSLPRFSVGEKRFGAFDEYLRDGDHEPPRSSCGSCRLSVCAADVPILFSDMLNEAQREAKAKGAEFPFPEPLVLTLKQNKRNAFPELDGVPEELGVKSPCKVYGGRGGRGFENSYPDLLPKKMNTIREQSGNHGRPGDSNTSSLPLPEIETGIRGGRLEADGFKVEGFPGACPVFMPEGDVCKTVKGEIEPAACTRRKDLDQGIPFSTSKAMCSVKNSVQFLGTKATMLDQGGMGCSGHDCRPAEKCKSFVGETFKAFPEKEFFGSGGTRRGTEEIIMGSIGTGSQLPSGKPRRLTPLYSVLFPETEYTKTIPNVEVKCSQSEFIKKESSKLKGAECIPHKKMGSEVMTPKSVREANNFVKQYSSFEKKNGHAFTERESKPSRPHGMRRSAPDVGITQRSLEDRRTTDSVTFLDKETVKNICEVKVATGIIKTNVKSVKVKREHDPSTRGRAIGCRKEACEAEVSSRSGAHDTPRRKSFRLRQKMRNKKSLARDTDRFPNEAEDSVIEGSEDDLELKISKILGFDPGKTNEEGANFRSTNSDHHQNSAWKKMNSSANRYSPSDTTLLRSKTLDRKIEKDNAFRSLPLPILDRKRSAVLLQNSTTLQSPQKELQPELAKPKQRPKIRVSSPRVEIRPRKSFQGERKKEERDLTASFAVVKRSLDPQEDFRESMVEMISHNRIARPEELENLLASYLSLNSNEHHDVIVKAFRQVWFDLGRACVVSDYLDLEGNRRV